MKLLAPFTTLTALATSCVFVKIVSARRLLEPQVVASVSVVGSDDYSIVVNKFANGEVRGILQNLFNVDGRFQIKANIDCLKITTDDTGVKTAAISGIVTSDDPPYPVGSTVLTAVKIDAGGTGYYTSMYNVEDGITCTNYEGSFVDWVGLGVRQTGGRNWIIKIEEF